MLPLLPDIIAVLLPSSGSGIDTRSEFRRKLIGRNQKQVIEAVGKPDSTQESGRHRYWYYEGRTRDEVTGNIDSRAQVCFEDGIVTSVNY